MRDSSDDENEHRSDAMRAALWVAILASSLSGVVTADELPKPPQSKTYPYVNTLEASIYRGEIAFKHYCVLCHGVKADGDGRAAKLYQPRPANLLTSDKNVQYKELIIRKGGAALARSEFMPPWEKELTNEQINDVLAYLTSIQQNAAKK